MRGEHPSSAARWTGGSRVSQISEKSLEAEPRDGQGSDGRTGGSGCPNVVCALEGGRVWVLRHSSTEVISYKGGQSQNQWQGPHRLVELQGWSGKAGKEGRTMLCVSMSFLGHLSLFWS